MFSPRTLAVACATAATLLGAAAPSDAMLRTNTLTLNGLNMNGLTYIGLTNNGLSSNALTANALTANALTANSLSLNSLALNALAGTGATLGDLNGVRAEGVVLPPDTRP